jgi:hypothetical protein
MKVLPVQVGWAHGREHSDGSHAGGAALDDLLDLARPYPTQPKRRAGAGRNRVGKSFKP